jgi:chromate transporter
LSSELPKEAQENASVAEATALPQSVAEVFWGFTWLALQGFGGVLAVAQRVLVEEKRWLSRTEFVEQWAVAQVLPGPNVVNLAIMLGDRFFGLRGAFAALAGMLCFPLLVVLSLVALAAPFANNPAFVGALKGMGAVSAGLIAAAGLRLMPALKQNPLLVGVSIGFVAITFALVAWVRLPLVQVLLGVGGVACVWAYLRLRSQDLAAGNGNGNGDKPQGPK